MAIDGMLVNYTFLIFFIAMAYLLEKCSSFLFTGGHMHVSAADSPLLDSCHSISASFIEIHYVLILSHTIKCNLSIILLKYKTNDCVD
jgi:hypothetical protein